MADNPKCPSCGHYNAIMMDGACRDCGHNVIDAEIAKLPGVFKLRGFPGEYFRVSRVASYLGDAGAVIYLQIFSRADNGHAVWKDHSKGSLREILRELIELSGNRRFKNADEVDAFLTGGEQPDQHLLAKLEES